MAEVLKGLFSFRTRSQPYMVRLSYRYEMRSALTFPLAASLAEGSFTSVVAAKNFDASIVLMSVIAAAPMFGNILAMLWSELAVGRRKVPLVNMLQLGVVLLIGSVALDALIPSKQVAGWVFALQIVAARLLASGITTLRSSIWRANYPRQVRGHIVSRISALATLALAVTTLAGSWWLDLDSRAYVYLYPAATVLGLIGIWQFSHIRIRREHQMRRREQQLYTLRPESVAETDEANVLNYTPGPRANWFGRVFTQPWKVLGRDRDFRHYQWWQFISGMSFMMFQPVLLFIVSKELTDPKKEYMLATTVVQIVPMVFSFIFASVWAPLFDRLHITKFRVVQMRVAVCVHAMMLAGAIVATQSVNWALILVALGQALVGVSNAAGNLAWNLGHNDFAKPEEAETYMAVHVMLTGLRGCMAPFMGAGLYYLLRPHGYLVFVVSGLTCLTSLLGFASMARHAPPKHGVIVENAGPILSSSTR